MSKLYHLHEDGAMTYNLILLLFNSDSERATKSLHKMDVEKGLGSWVQAF